MKDPHDPNHWLIDPEAAAIVKRIFDMCLEGRGPHQIANQLTAENILCPAAYKNTRGIHAFSVIPENPCHWNCAVVAQILEMRDYTGCLVNFKSYSNSLWDQKRRLNAEDKQAVFPNHHEAIIEEDVFQHVQEIRKHRHRRTRSGKSSIFSGLVFCADCREKMYYSSRIMTSPNQERFTCKTHQLDGTKCSSHYIREIVLEEMVLAHLKMVMGHILRYETHFRQVMEERKLLQCWEAISIREKHLSRNEKRIEELKSLFIKIYEDNAAGRLNDSRYELLSQSYEAEQKQLEEEAARLQKEIEVQEKQNEGIEQFIQSVKTHVGIEKLDGSVLHELVKAIYIGAPDKSSGHRVQHIYIEYNGIGFIPLEELTKTKTA